MIVVAKKLSVLHSMLLPNYAENRFQQFGGNVLIEGLTLQHCLTLRQCYGTK